MQQKPLSLQQTYFHKRFLRMKKLLLIEPVLNSNIKGSKELAVRKIKANKAENGIFSQ